jgi:hypothetical protein
MLLNFSALREFHITVITLEYAYTYINVHVEWGYTTCVPACIGQYTSLDLQARYLARTWLINIMSGIPISIWFAVNYLVHS